MYIKCGTAKSLYPDKTIDQNAVPKRVRAESARSQRVEKLPSYTAPPVWTRTWTRPDYMGTPSRYPR